MAQLAVDTRSHYWLLIKRYVEQRRAELATECCAIGTMPARREELAARIAELDDLLAAPGSTQLEVRMTHDDHGRPGGMY